MIELKETILQQSPLKTDLKLCLIASDFSDIDGIVKKLTPRLKRFCLLYVNTMNKTKAALKAGYSEATARQKGHNMSKDVYIKRYVLYLLHLNRMLGRITKEDIIRRCNEIILNYKSANAKIGALNLIAKLTGLDNNTKTQPVFGDNSLITINITKKTD